MMSVPSRLALVLLCSVLCACTGDGGDRDDPGPRGEGHAPARPLPNVFISPAGEPFRAERGKPYPVADWFTRANAAHDGKLTQAEFRADALRFFDRLDKNHDAVIDGQELGDYEQDVAPEILPHIESLRAEEGMDTSLTYGDPNNSDNRPDGRRLRGPDSNRPLDTGRGVGMQGAAVYSLLNVPEPVAAADASFDGRITRTEYAQAIDRRFDQLDKAGLGYLTLAALPKTPLQEAILKREKARKGQKDQPVAEAPTP